MSQGQREKQAVGSSSDTQDQSPARLVKLISVQLKESALDSPSFRAAASHHNAQVEQAEQWVEGLVKSLRRYPSQLSDLGEANTVLLDQLMPDFVRHRLVDQENTLAVLETTKLNLNGLWATALRDLEIREPEVVELLTELTRKSIRGYKEKKKNYEFLQGKYDTFLAKYSAQSKAREPSALREDSFQLYEVRKSYLGASLDLCLEMAQFHQVFDTAMMKLTEVLFRDKTSYDENYYVKVRAWCDAVSKSIQSLVTDLTHSKTQIYRATIAQFEPSRDLADHNPLSLDISMFSDAALLSNSKKTESHEKHGWLYMKTSVGKPARQIWVRRWLFVKNGIFGIFSLSPSKKFVQESDKIGVLLANIRFAPDEDRRFCFEIKSIDCTIVLQAETLKELKSWLKVFALEKQFAISNSNSDVAKFAFGRYPPSFYEFASTSLTTMDTELTSSRVENANNDDTSTIVTSTHLSSLIGGMNDNFDFKFPTSNAGEFREPDMNTPIVTSRSKLALLARAFLEPTVIPNAVTANLWGCVNWGMYYMNNKTGDFDGMQTPRTGLIQNNLTSLSQPVQYPANYPTHLKSYDIQLKAIFDSCIDPDEFVLGQFTCLWSLNPQQELSGRCFYTVNHAYIYLNSTGFISLLKKPLRDAVAIDVSSDRFWDVLKVYDIRGLNMKGRLFLEDSKLVQKKLDILINNLARDKPRPQDEIISIMESLESDELKKNESKRQSKRSHQDSNVYQNDSELYSFQPFNGITIGKQSMKVNYGGDYNLLNVENYDAPAKAVFHILLGDLSNVFKESVTLIDSDDFSITPWYQTKDGVELKRYINYKVSLSKSIVNLRGTHGHIPARTLQTIEEVIDNKYYRIGQAHNTFKTPGSGLLDSDNKIIIVQTDAGSCKVLFYHRIQTKGVSTYLGLKSLLTKGVTNFQKEEFNKTRRGIRERVNALGSHGKIVKAIRTFGNLSKSDEIFQSKDEVLFDITLGLVIKYYSKLGLYLFASILLNSTHYIIQSITSVVLGLTVNKTLTGLLVLSILFNTFLLGRSTVSYWYASKSVKLINGIRQELDITKMERSISLNDLEVLSSYDYNSSSICFDKFLTSRSNDEVGLRVDTRFRDTRHEIAIKRNELLVELKILEKVEKELISGSYKNFLISELNLCKISMDDMKIDNEVLKEYCSSCIDEFKRVSSELL